MDHKLSMKIDEDFISINVFHIIRTEYKQQAVKLYNCLSSFEKAFKLHLL
jgi:hypothetical protein